LTSVAVRLHTTWQREGKKEVLKIEKEGKKGKRRFTEKGSAARRGREKKQAGMGELDLTNLGGERKGRKKLIDLAEEGGVVEDLTINNFEEEREKKNAAKSIQSKKKKRG